MKTKIIAAIIAAVLLVVLISGTDICFGTCLDSDGNGKIFTRSPYNYISYSGVPDVRPGDLILTVEFINPFVGEDDIIFRSDFILTEEA